MTKFLWITASVVLCFLSLLDNYFLLDSVDDWESKLDCWTQTAKVLGYMAEDVAKKFPGNYHWKNMGFLKYVIC